MMVTTGYKDLSLCVCVCVCVCVWRPVRQCTVKFPLTEGMPL